MTCLCLYQAHAAKLFRLGLRAVRNNSFRVRNRRAALAWLHRAASRNAVFHIIDPQRTVMALRWIHARKGPLAAGLGPPRGHQCTCNDAPAPATLVTRTSANLEISPRLGV